MNEGDLMKELELAKLLSDDELVLRLRRCVREDRELTARLLIHFGEVDARGLYRDQGFSSMFDYAVSALHMSESEAALRIRTARVAREFPAALEMVARGELNLTALKLLAPVLTQDNAELLEMARFKSKLALQELIAKHFPSPDVPDSIRRLPERAAVCASAQLLAAPVSQGDRAQHSLGALNEIASQIGNGQPVPPRSPEPAPKLEPNSGHLGLRSPSPQFSPLARDAAASVCTRASAQPGMVVPLSEGRYKVVFTGGQSLNDKLKEAQDLMRHQVPNGELAVIFERALDSLIADRKKQCYAQVETPRVREAVGVVGAHETHRSSAARTRYIPREVRRDVFLRDGGRCCFTSAGGKRCAARGYLEFHHIIAFALGGTSTVDNICLMCRAHNALLGERDYGREYVRARIEKRQTSSKAAAQAQTSQPIDPVPDEQAMTRSCQQHSDIGIGEQPNKATGSRRGSNLISVGFASEAEQLKPLAAERRPNTARNSERAKAQSESVGVT
jgi:5-methylcytosine-specific restriction endonuclease McrA